MKRRNFSKKILAGAVISAVSYPLNAFYSSSVMKRKILKPKRLKKGDTIGLIAPGSPIDEKKLEKAVQLIEQLELKPHYTKNILAKHGYLAGHDDQRLSDLHGMFADSKIDGIWCIRGGYGTTRLLPSIDYSLIKKNPKALIGYSDITALLQAIYKKTGLIGFHGPVAVSEPTNYTLDYFKKVLIHPEPQIVINNAPENQHNQDQAYQTRVIRAGKARGKLIGGNLSLINALVGTEYSCSFKNKILFLEDVGEKPYRIDRMLTQLRQASDLHKAAAIILGVFNDCEGGANSLSLQDMLNDRLGDLNIPVIYGMSFGHIDHQFTFPIGIRAELDTAAASLTLLEEGVEG